jgi:LAO/AO transport system kinase
MLGTINEHLKNHFYNNKEIIELMSELEQRVVDDKISSFVAAQNILDYYFKSKL